MIIGWVVKGVTYCSDDAPGKVEEMPEDDVIPVLDSDTWVMDVGVCIKCRLLIATRSTVVPE